jgi:hypothetical protein
MVLEIDGRRYNLQKKKVLFIGYFHFENNLRKEQKSDVIK